MNEILENLFGNNQCSFGEAMLEFAIIGLGFFLLGLLLRSLFRTKNYKKAYEEMALEVKPLRLDKRRLTAKVENSQERIYQLQRELRALKKRS